jgi:hypothetical protein
MLQLRSYLSPTTSQRKLLPCGTEQSATFASLVFFIIELVMLFTYTIVVATMFCLCKSYVVTDG